MMFDNRKTLISESTFESNMRRTMDCLEEKLHRGETTVQLDIREFLHILSRMVTLHQDRLRVEAMLFGNFTELRNWYNLQPPAPQVIAREEAKNSEGAG